jgi:hydroxymethylbilane synthase
MTAVAAEQAFTRVVGGGCKLPVACYARVKASFVELHAMVGDSNGLNAELASASGPVPQAILLAEQLAHKLTVGKALT